MTANTPALSVSGGEIPGWQRSGSTGEPLPGPDGRPVLNAQSGSLADLPSPKLRTAQDAKPAEPIAAEASPDDEMTAALVDDLNRAATDLQRPLPPPPKAPKPRREDFNDPFKYDDALVAWSAEQATANTVLDAEKQRRAQEFKAANNALWTHVTECGAREFADYEAVALADHIPISTDMSSAIIRQPNGHRVAYHLGKNPAEATRIAKLAPLDQVVEIGKLAARVVSTPSTSKPRASRPKSINELSMEEYAQKRTAELRAAANPRHTAGVKP